MLSELETQRPRTIRDSETLIQQVQVVYSSLSALSESTLNPQGVLFGFSVLSRCLCEVYELFGVLCYRDLRITGR